MFNKGKLDYVDWGWKLFKAAFMFTNDCEARTSPPLLEKRQTYPTRSLSPKTSANKKLTNLHDQSEQTSLL